MLCPLALALVLVASAQAQVDGGSLTSGVPVNGAVTTADGIEYTVTGVAGQHITFAITNAVVSPSGGALQIEVVGPNGPEASSESFATGQTTDVNFAPSTSDAGPLDVIITPWGGTPDATGTFTLTYSTDVTGTLTSGVAVPTTIPNEGEDADYTFTAVPGQHLTIAITLASVSPAGGAFQIEVVGPNGPEGSEPMFSTGQTTDVNFTPASNEGGTTDVIVSAWGGTPAATGGFTLTYALDVTHKLSSGVGVKTTIAYEGQDVDDTFTAVPGQHVTIAISKASAAPADAALQIEVVGPNGQEGSEPTFSTGQTTDVNFIPASNEGGTTHVIVFPWGGTPSATGSFTLTYAKDVVRNLTSGRAVRTALKIEGQDADDTFVAVAGAHVTVAVSNVKLSESGVAMQIEVVGPNGQEGTEPTFSTGQTTDVNFIPASNEGGTTHVIVFPWGGTPSATGSFTLTYATDVTGSLTSGTPVSTGIKYEGQDDDYTFTAVAGVPVTIGVSNASVSAPGSALQLEVVGPNGKEGSEPTFATGNTATVSFTPTSAGTTSVIVFAWGGTPLAVGTFTLTYTAGAG